MRCLVVIPTYNERENLAPLVAAVLRQGEMFDVLVVDDNSPDGTVTSPIGSLRARRVCGCFTVPGRMGLGTAYVARLRLAADYDFLFEMDADFSHDPSYLPGSCRRWRTAATSSSDPGISVAVAW